MSDQTAPEAQAPAPTTSLDELRAVACEVAGLPPELASRLQGQGLAELCADARALAALTAPPAPEPAAAPEAAAPAAPEPAAAPNPEDGLDGGVRRDPSGGWTRESVAQLAKRDPHRFNALVEKGDIDLAKVTR